VYPPVILGYSAGCPGYRILQPAKNHSYSNVRCVSTITQKSPSSENEGLCNRLIHSNSVTPLSIAGQEALRRWVTPGLPVR